MPRLPRINIRTPAYYSAWQQPQRLLLPRTQLRFITKGWGSVTKKIKQEVEEQLARTPCA